MGTAYLSADLYGGEVTLPELTGDDGPIEVQGHLLGCHVMPADVFAWTVTDLVREYPEGNPWLASARDLPPLNATTGQTWR